jgi:SAM-dependent methyltransferase
MEPTLSSSVINCPCCSAAATPWLTANDSRRLSKDDFCYFRCGGCGLAFIDPVPMNLERFYRGGYQPIPKSLTELRLLAAKERYRLDTVMEKAGGDLLEIGPWIGIFSINAKDAGFKVEAIEMSAEASRFLRDEAGIHVTNTHDARTALLASDKHYDVIVLWHSLEHLLQPWKVLEAVSKRLKPGGILLVAIPNIESVQAKMLGGRWLHLDAPRHLYFWSPNDLARLVNGFGLKTERIDTTDHLSGLLSRNAWEHYFWYRLRCAPWIRTIIPKMLAPIVSAFTQRPGRGAGLTATFRAPT